MSFWPAAPLASEPAASVSDLESTTTQYVPVPTPVNVYWPEAFVVTVWIAAPSAASGMSLPLS